MRRVEREMGSSAGAVAGAKERSTEAIDIKEGEERRAVLDRIPPRSKRPVHARSTQTNKTQRCGRADGIGLKAPVSKRN